MVVMMDPQMKHSSTEVGGFSRMHKFLVRYCLEQADLQPV